MKLKELLVGTKVIEVSGNDKLKKIPIEKLDSMLDYQRDIDMNFVDMISQDNIFDEKEVSVILVSVRQDGSMKVCDGQHTIAILKQQGYSSAICELRHNLTAAEENDWFNIENSKRRSQSSKRLLTTAIHGTYEKHKDEQDFYNCLKSLGFKLNIYGEAGNNFKVGCAASLLNVYKEYVKSDKKEQFIECLDIHKTSFNGDSISLQWSFVRGLFDFYQTYSEEFDRKRLVEVLSREKPKDIKKDAEADIRTKKTSTKYAKLFVEKYNYKVVKKNQLKMTKLEN